MIGELYINATKIDKQNYMFELTLDYLLSYHWLSVSISKKFQL